MCLYVTYPLELIPYPNVIAPMTTKATVPELYVYPYDASKDHNLGPFSVPNGLSLESGPHPSERIIGSRGIYDGTIDASTLRDDRFVRLDSFVRIQNSSMAIHAIADSDVALVGPATQSHHHGQATCENIGACALSGEVAGSKCTGKGGKIGFCYLSSKGTLECGRTLFLDSRFAISPTFVNYANGHLQGHRVGGDPHRCPAGTDMDYQGKRTVRRLLIGGCMVPTDPRYRPTAEVHVEADCLNQNGRYQHGCMFPGARNFAPGSVSPGKCLYQVGGCTSPTALNYNSEASVNDGSCVEPITGCTLKGDAYSDVDASTPMYKGRYVGLPAPNVGRVNFAGYQSILNPSATANVNTGCVVAIEGCTSPSAANYNSHANVNSNTWCIPKVEGCMMPDPPSSSSQATLTLGRLHAKDGGSGTYNPLATVHKKSACNIGRVGCTDSFAINYDARATIDDGTCYLRQDGCLDKAALNFNCTARGAAKCTTPESYPMRYLPSADGTYVATPSRASVHAQSVCVYDGDLVPPPPSPALPAGIETEEIVSVIVLASGSVEDYTQSDKDKLALAFATKFDVNLTKVRVLVRAASVEIEVQVVVTDAQEAQTLRTTAEAALSSVDAAAQFFAASGARPGGKPISILSAPVITERTIAAITPPAPPPSTPVGAIVGGVVGGIVALLLIAAVARMMASPSAPRVLPSKGQKTRGDKITYVA